MNQRNYQKELDRILDRLEQEGKVPSLLLHSCCAPCSSYVLEYLSRYFSITVFYFNPNIYPPEEYGEREREQERLIAEMDVCHPVRFLKGTYDPDVFYRTVKGLEKEPEGGGRCTECFRLRLREAAGQAAAGGYDFFATTLTISPLKDARRLNDIGEEEGRAAGVAFLPSDFKKRNGYKRSLELSALHHLYRQDYCGCVFSREERRRQKEETEAGKK